MKTSDCYKDMITAKLDKVYNDKGLSKESLEDLRGLFTLVLSELDKKDAIALDRDTWIQNQDLLINGLNEQIERMTEAAR